MLSLKAILKIFDVVIFEVVQRRQMIQKLKIWALKDCS